MSHPRLPMIPGMEDVLIALGASFVLAFVVAGPKARRAVEVIEPAKPEKPKKPA